MPALALLCQYLRTKDLDTMKLARLLDRSWGYAERVRTGAVRPDAGAMFVLRRVARIPLDAWMTKDERVLAKVAS